MSARHPRSFGFPAHAAFAAGLVVFALAAAAAPVPMVVGKGLVLACNQPDPESLRCDYRITGGGRPLAAVASIGDVTLPAPAFAARTGAPGSVAILLLVDTSDPGRAPAMRRIAEHVGRLVDSAESHQRFGLASFDSDLRLLAPIGSTADAIKTAAAALEAEGRTTELYRNVVEALRLLSTATDEHKVLVVLSDGLAEDRAYFHDDAVAEALTHRIAVYGMGYPRSVPLSVGLQSLRRLAEETGGRFVAASATFDLPDAFFESPLVAVENVGALTVDLSNAIPALPGGTHALRVGLETSAGPTEARVSVVLPGRASAEPVVRVVEVEVPRVVEVERVVEVPAPAPAAAPAPPPTPAGVPLWYWVAAIGLLALALLALLLVLLMQRRGAVQAPARAAPAPAPLPGVAQLVVAGEEDEPHPIVSATYRIGRLSDNDLVLRDPSVSRHHAEIRRRRDGTFQLLDLDSMNGVLVNGRKVRECDLSGGDSLEVGDVRVTFTVPESVEDPGEETVMMKTVTPDQPFPEAASGRR